ncbi:adhesin, partial [Mesorhizobium sp. ESP7-2]|uniref:beta strand repeat-containing protein n=1 Tax=Mesorhizobium sp. ESP7-2 TaxID=2876622 RepID=UPI00398C56FA|nr:adhesin [Mesorhizobium sp. ESP7-2]
ATVSISGNFAAGQDVLGFTSQNGITGSYNASTGVLTLSGTSSVANYQAALRSVTYFNTSDAPSGAARTVSYQVDDGSASNHASNVATATVSVTPVNDAPVVNANGGSLSYTENQAPTAIGTAIAVSDVDSANLTGATVSISGNFAAGQDVLGFTSQNGITGSYNASTGVLTLSGTSSVANYQAALRSVTYFNTSDDLSGAARTISYQVDDGSASNHASNVATATVSVTPVNDAPVNTVPGAQTTGANTSKAITGLSISDVDARTGSETVTLSVAHGALAVSGGTAAISGSGTVSVTLTGTVAAINSTLGATVTYTPATGYSGGDTLTMVTNDNGNTGGGALTDTDTVTITVSPPADTTPPTVSNVTANPHLSNTTNSGVITIQFSEVVKHSTLSLDSGAGYITISKGTLSNLIAVDSGGNIIGDGSGDSQFYNITYTKGPGNNSSLTLTVAPGFQDLAGNQQNAQFSTSNTFPAGVSGEPIHLGLADPGDGTALVTVTVKDLPSGLTIDGATQNADGSWTVQSNAVQELTVTTPADFVGAAVLDVSMIWTNADGTTGSVSIADNVEAYAPGSPIFAWSGDDVLTGSSGNDLFVFSQPIGNDTVHSFDAAADQVDLIGYSGFQSFADVQAHTADDANGNAVITLGDGQSITLEGVHSSGLGTGNFVFDQTPVVNNAGTMTLSDGALLPLSGTINNTGLISLDAASNETLLQLIQHGITLQGGGQIVLSDSDWNVISGTSTDVTLTNVDNTISGAGQLGDGLLSLNNQGTIIATGTHALVIDTGANTTVNSGTLEATGSGGLTITGTLANSGLIWANGGNITINGQVTGEGDAIVGNLSKLEFGTASSAGVTFAQNAAGTLELDDSFDFSGRIGGITNDDKLDLNDILFGTGTTVAYQASQDGSGGTLIVSDGAHNATLHLLGTYDANGFKLADDGEGHTVVTYNPEFTLTGVAGGTSEFV